MDIVNEIGTLSETKECPVVRQTSLLETLKSQQKALDEKLKSTQELIGFLEKNPEFESFCKLLRQLRY